MNKQIKTLHRNERRAGRAPGFSWLRAAVGALILGAITSAAGTADAETRSLNLYNVHTKESATIVYKRDGEYDRAGLAKLNQFLRDWRRNEPTKMDPHLFDLIWEVYRKSGSHDAIHVICGYRSPETNGMLRRRSKGVAQHSQHMLGKAMDFYIPDVPLAKLRAIGLRAEVGGVGFYPTSGSPFVHMDTGSVRHWPRMSRSELVKIFPHGKTLHIPSDGKPLPGYAQALAEHKLRSRSGDIKIASFDDNNTDTPPLPPTRRKNVGDPVVIASVSNDSADDEASVDAAEVADIEPPLPRPSPIPIDAAKAPVVVASVEPAPQFFQPSGTSELGFGSTGNGNAAPRRVPPFDFESASHWTTPAVPADLAQAMAERDVSRATSLPIRPTAVVATIDVSRPLRAEAMTAAVMQGAKGTVRDVTPVFAYAATMEASTPTPPRQPEVAVTNDFGSPIPVANPLRVTAAPSAAPTAAPSVARRAPNDDLTLTALDTLGLRLWMASQSTRQKRYAVLTMPDFSQMPSLIDKPVMAYSIGFGDQAYQGLRTDSFSGPLVQLPAVIDLRSRARLAYR